MAEKVFTKFLENFKGLDLRASDLTRKPEYSSQLDNLILDRTQTLIGRKGFKAAAQHEQREGLLSSRVEYPLWGLYNYTSLDQNTGETKEELIGVGDYLYRLAEGTMTIAYAGAGTTATFSFLPTALGWVLDLKVDGISQTGFPLGITYNSDATSPTTFSSLRTAINAVAGFTCTLTPWAQVNGNQVNRGISAAITVDAGHTVTISTTKPTTLPFINRATADLVFLDFVAQGATTLTPLFAPTISVNDNDEIGVAHASVFALPIIEGTSVKPNTTFTFTYWEKIYAPSDYQTQGGRLPSLSLSSPFSGEPPFSIPNPSSLYLPSAVAACDPSFVNISATIANNTLFIAAPNPISEDPYTGTGSSFAESPKRELTLLQYDGQQMILGSMPQMSPLTLTAVAGAGLSTGVYKYLARIKFINKQGQVFYGNDSLLLKESTVTTTGVNANVTVASGIISASNRCQYFPEHRAVASAGATGATFAVSSNHTLRVGDRVAVIDRATGRLERRTISAVGNLSISITGSDITVNNGDLFSNDLVVELYRTTVFGNQYYLVGEYPFNGAGGFSFTDTVADTSLLIKWDGPFLGTNRRDSAPTVTKIASHQGSIVGTGDRLNPNTVFWSVPGEPFAWPAGTNNTDISSGVGGVLTAIGSDNESTLIVGKENAYYAISGDLGTAQVSVTTSSEGDTGIPSQSSLIKARESLLYLSNKGPRLSLSGAVDGFADRLISVFLNNGYQQTIGSEISGSDETKLVVRRAVSGHDLEGQKILFWVGGEMGTPGVNDYNLRPSSSSFVITYDYANDVFSKYTFSNIDDGSYNMAGGIAYYKGDLYFLSRSIPLGAVSVRGMLYKFNNTNTQYDYCDDSRTISHVWRPSHDTGDEPSVNKEFLRLKVYSFLPSSLSFNPFVVTLTTYKDWITSSSHFSTTYNFAASTDREKISKLRSDKMRVCLFQFSVSTLFKSPRITGYEYVIALPYKKDDLA